RSPRRLRYLAFAVGTGHWGVAPRGAPPGGQTGASAFAGGCSEDLARRGLSGDGREPASVPPRAFMDDAESVGGVHRGEPARRSTGGAHRVTLLSVARDSAGMGVARPDRGVGGFGGALRAPGR